MRILLACLALAACSCSQQPIEPDAQTQIATLKDGYIKSLEAAHGVCSPACFQAQGAIVHADQERTASAIHDAQAALSKFRRETIQ